MKKMTLTVALALTVLMPVLRMQGQTSPAQASPAPASPQAPAQPAAPTPQGPIAQGPAAQAAAPANPFPPVNLKNFTADSPSREQVNGFLHAIWGFDTNRIWSVAAILKTPAPGVAKVVVYLADKTAPGKDSQAVFFVTPDGQHAIAGNVVDFGSKPFAANRQILEERADGPVEGATDKSLLLVEFADLQCPHCKEAQGTMASLARDFPEARIVFENVPLSETHPYAFRAAAEGACVRQAKGDAAFFKYAQAVYDKQDQLTASGVDAALAAAVTAAGGDPKAAATCASAPATQDAVKASIKLAVDLGVEETPVLSINGHLLPLTSMNYETLKRIVAFQAGEDGVTVHVQPTLTNLH